MVNLMSIWNLILITMVFSHHNLLAIIDLVYCVLDVQNAERSANAQVEAAAVANAVSLASSAVDALPTKETAVQAVLLSKETFDVAVKAAIGPNASKNTTNAAVQVIGVLAIHASPDDCHHKNTFLLVIFAISGF